MATNRSLSRNYMPYNDKKNDNRHYMYPIVCAGVMFLIGMILYSTFAGMRIIPAYAKDLTLLVPCLFFIPVGVFAYKGIVPKKHSRIVTTILLIMGIVSMPLCGMQIVMEIYSTPIEGTAYYEKTMDMLNAKDDALLSSFPTSVPQDAQDAAFNYYTDMGNGAMVIRLTFRTGEGMHEPLETALQSRAGWTGSASELATSEYADALDHVDVELPDDAVYYLVDAAVDEASGQMNGVMMGASADDGTLYYLYKLWTP